MLVSSALAGGFADPALSQVMDGTADQANVPVRQRAHPEHDPLGIFHDGFFFYPSVTAATQFDSNVFATHDAPSDDMAVIVTPALLVRYEGESHREELKLSARHYEFEHFDSENRTEANARLTSSRQITNDLKFESLFEAARRFEQRGDSLTATSSKSPIAYNDLRGEGGLTQTFNHLGVTIGGGVRSVTFEDNETLGGAPLDQSFRNGTIVTASIRPFYEFSPGYKAFVRFESNWRDFQGTGTLDRDSSGFIARSGVEFLLTPVLSGSVEAGYLQQHYDNPAIPTADGASGLGRLTWLMTPLMTVSLFGSRAIADLAAEDQDARIDLTGGVRIDYEPLRDLIAGVEASFTHEDFTGSPRQDEVLKVETSIDYFMNSNIEFGLHYIFDSRQSDISDFSFDRHRFTVNVTAQY